MDSELKNKEIIQEIGLHKLKKINDFIEVLEEKIKSGDDGDVKLSFLILNLVDELFYKDEVLNKLINKTLIELDEFHKDLEKKKQRVRSTIKSIGIKE